MELEFKREQLNCLGLALREVQTGEQTQELRLSDGMPDIGRVICAWGQAVHRGKEWMGDRVAFSGGMQVWVLYAPEDGSEERCVSGWIPFQMQWDLPESLPDGHIRIQTLPRVVDARSISPRKLMLRCGFAVQAEVYGPKNLTVSAPPEKSPQVELRRSRYPLRLHREAGEKAFSLDEELTLPDSAPRPEKLIYAAMDAEKLDSRVLAGRLVFRGTGKLHILYRSTEGQLHSWDFEIPFSQFAELGQDHSADAQGELLFGVTSLEPELEDSGVLRLKCGLVAQYLICDRVLLEIAEDAYSVSNTLEISLDTLEVPVVLDSRRETLNAEQTVPVEANIAADVRFLPEFPRQRQMDDVVELAQNGTFQVLYYCADGILRSTAARWEGSQRIPAGEDSTLLAQPRQPETEAVPGSGQMTAKAQLSMEITARARQQFPMVTGVTLGEPSRKDPQRPSLILRRCRGSGLWNIAKESGSTEEAIRQANGITEEPAPEQLLLIPVL